MKSYLLLSNAESYNLKNYIFASECPAISLSYVVSLELEKVGLYILLILGI